MTDNKPAVTQRKPANRADSWERQVLEKLAYAALEEQRRSRRFKVIIFSVVIAFLLLPVVAQMVSSLAVGKHTALVEMAGVIAPEESASADNVVTGLRSAFESQGTVGVILRVNSPGGSPVQSRYIYDEIRRLRAKYPEIPLYAVVTDVCASGCYYAVAAADKIYVSPGSLVGSIGVLMDGFGFTEAIKKIGVERRLYTAGEHKGILDPFSPVKPAERRHAQQMLDRIHQQFIDAVREGRGEALKETRDMFSGLFWTGEDAKALGLADEFGSASQVARDVIGEEHIVDFTARENVLDSLARRFGTALGQGLGSRLFSPALR